MYEIRFIYDIDSSHIYIHIMYIHIFLYMIYVYIYDIYDIKDVCFEMIYIYI